MKNLFSLLLLVISILFTGVATGQDAMRVSDMIELRIAAVPASDQSSIGGKYSISSSGTIALPYLNQEIKAAGLRFSDLARNVEAAYKAAGIYTNPRITITGMMETTVVQRLVTVGGEVRAPGVVQWRDGLTILDAIIEKGGFGDFAKTKEVRLMRGSATTVHNLRDVTKDPSQNVRLQVNDRIIVPGGF
jgi:polysaccharide biosynthesis/export protein VpsN